jgi:hypothetical protein
MTVESSLVEEYAKGDFIWPIKHEVKISGTFAELRPNHFHTGIDLKSSTGGIGDPVLASCGGYVSRIKVQSASYGKALYVSHPNGYTTVYAHLDRFTDEIEEYVKEQQYSKKSFFVDLHPTSDQFLFEQGDYIGVLGNRGRSTGPHLHFEIRKTEGQIPVNPFLLGLKSRDKGYVNIRGVKVNELTEDFQDIDSHKRTKAELGQSPLILIDNQRFGVSVEGFHHMNQGKNRNGLYRIEMMADDQTIYDIKYNQMSFSKMRYCNAVTDYSERRKTKKYFHRLYKLPGDQIKYHNVLNDNGMITLQHGERKKILIRAHSYDGLIDSLSFIVQHKMAKGISSMTTTSFSDTGLGGQIKDVIHDKDFYHAGEFYSIQIPALSLYRDMTMDINPLRILTLEDNSHDIFSPYIQFQDEMVPIHKRIKIGIRPHEKTPQANSDKLVIVRCDPAGELSYYGGDWEGSYLICQTREFGTYCIMEDIKAPTIKAKRFDYNMTGRKKMIFEVVDNFRGTPFTFYATVDDNWILMEHDAKTNTLFHVFDDRIGKGEHYLKLHVTDDRNNKTTFEGLFKR